MQDKPIIIGCDEVGYGPIAGPLVVCGVKAPKDWTLPGLNDSKKLTPKQRDKMFVQIMECVKNKEIQYHRAERSNVQIDEKGVWPVLKEAYVEVFHALYLEDSLLIIDGNLTFDNLGVDAYDKVSVAKADSKFPTVMAASIIAKVSRDYDMRMFHHQYPVYGWASNVGYPAPAHIEGIRKYGYSPLHRMSYRVKSLQDR